MSATIGAWMEARSREAAAVEFLQLREVSVATFAKVGFTTSQVQDFVVVLSMFEAAPDRALEALLTPMLAIYGSKDNVIASDLSTEAAAASLPDNREALVVLVLGRAHELARATPATATDAVPEDGTITAALTLSATGSLADRQDGAARNIGCLRSPLDSGQGL